MLFFYSKRVINPEFSLKYIFINRLNKIYLPNFFKKTLLISHFIAIKERTLLFKLYHNAGRLGGSVVERLFAFGSGCDPRVQDRVPHQASCMEPASPSAYVSLINKIFKIFFLKKQCLIVNLFCLGTFYIHRVPEVFRAPQITYPSSTVSPT